MNSPIDDLPNQRHKAQQALAEVQANKDAFSDEAYIQIAMSLMQQREQTAESGDDVSASGYRDIVQFLQIIFANFWVILVVGIIGSVVAYFVVEALPSIYETQTSLAVFPSFDQDAIPRPIDQIEIAMGTYVQVLRSEKLNTNVDKVLEDRFTPEAIADVETEVRPVETSSIIVVLVRSEDPELAQAYAGEVAKQIVDENPLPLFELAYRIEVLDSPSLPDEPSYPNIRVNLLLGIVGSFTVGVALAFLWHTYVRSRRTKM